MDMYVPKSCLFRRVAFGCEEETNEEERSRLMFHKDNANLIIALMNLNQKILKCPKSQSESIIRPFFIQSIEDTEI
jgi:hypothetical protein